MLAPEEHMLASESRISPKTDKEKQLACFAAELDLNNAELSTSDEILAGVSQTEESTEESDENPDLDAQSDFDVPSAEATVLQPLHDACCHPQQAVWTCDEEFQGRYQPVEYDDAW